MTGIAGRAKWFGRSTVPGAEDAGTFLGTGVTLKGRCRFDGAVRIDGRLEGDVQTNGTLEVGGQGVLIGRAHVGTLINGGTIRGIVVASERVCLLESSVLVGDLRTPQLTVAEGARLQGHCNREAHESAEGRPSFDAAPIEPVTGTLIGYEPCRAGVLGERTERGAQTVEEDLS